MQWTQTHGWERKMWNVEIDFTPIIMFADISDIIGEIIYDACE